MLTAWLMEVSQLLCILSLVLVPFCSSEVMCDLWLTWLMIEGLLFSEFKGYSSIARGEEPGDKATLSCCFMKAWTLLLSLHTIVWSNKGKSNPTWLCFGAAYTYLPSWILATVILDSCSELPSNPGLMDQVACTFHSLGACAKSIFYFLF